MIRIEKRKTFLDFLSNTAARDYVFIQASYKEQIEEAIDMLNDANYVLIGAGAGLSAAAGLKYSGKRFTDNFKYFIEKYGVQDMYSACFYPYPSEEARWGYWSKHVFINRIQPTALPLYLELYKIVKDKEYFVLTTNADHQFYKAGFGEDHIFATQGDYGLIQCMKGCHPKTYNNIKMINQMNQVRKDCLVPTYMVPRCPICGGLMNMNLRCDQYFVEDENWHKAEKNFGEFLYKCKNKKVVLLELGVGFNTPTIIRFPFEKLIKDHKNMKLIRLNSNEAFIPKSSMERAVGINEDIARSINDISEGLKNKREEDR